MEKDTDIGGPQGRFPATRRTFIAGLTSDDHGQRSRALETLVALYWKPLYKTARIRWQKSNEDAKDLTQEFLAHLMETDALSGYDLTRGSFRTYLRLLFERFAANAQKAATRQKRGGGAHELDFMTAEAELERQSLDRGLSAEEEFHREWARSVFTLAVETLRRDTAEKPRRFEIFEAYDLAADSERPRYEELAARFGVPVTTVTNELSAVRRRFREIVLETLREVTATDEEFRAEARALLGVRA